MSDVTTDGMSRRAIMAHRRRQREKHAAIALICASMGVLTVALINAPQQRPTSAQPSPAAVAWAQAPVPVPTPAPAPTHSEQPLRVPEALRVGGPVRVGPGDTALEATPFTVAEVIVSCAGQVWHAIAVLDSEAGQDVPGAGLAVELRGGAGVARAHADVMDIPEGESWQLLHGIGPCPLPGRADGYSAYLTWCA